MRAAGLFLIAVSLDCYCQKVSGLSGVTDGVSWPALSPDGATLAYGNDGIAVRPLGGGKAVRFAEWRDECLPIRPRWSPDGTQIAFLRVYCSHCDHKSFVKGFPTGPERVLGKVCRGTPAWTPNGRSLIATEPVEAGEACRVVLIPLAGGTRTSIGREGDAIALTVDGKRLAYSTGNGRVREGTSRD